MFFLTDLGQAGGKSSPPLPSGYTPVFQNIDVGKKSRDSSQTMVEVCSKGLN